MDKRTKHFTKAVEDIPGSAMLTGTVSSVADASGYLIRLSYDASGYLIRLSYRIAKINEWGAQFWNFLNAQVDPTQRLSTAEASKIFTLHFLSFVFPPFVRTPSNHTPGISPELTSFAGLVECLSQGVLYAKGGQS